MIVSRGQFAWLKQPASQWHRTEATELLAIVCLVVTSLSPWSRVMLRLNKSMLDDPDADSSVTVRFLFVTNHSAFDRGYHAVDWSIKQPHDEADR